MITKTTLPSGISNLPKLAPYPEILDLSKLHELEHTLCYVQDHPGQEGFTILIERDTANDDVFVMAGYLNGEAIELDSDTSNNAEMAKTFIKDKIINFLNLMRLVKIDRAQYFFSVKADNIILQDVQTAPDKFVGPGLIRDVFSALVPVPEIRKIEPLTAGNIEAIIMNTGSYEGDLMIKPSRFRIYDGNPNQNIPFYVEVLR